MEIENLIELTDRDWPEDFEDENGMYQNKCVYCKNLFFGYKRRVVCKICTVEINESVEKTHKITEDIKKCII